MKTKKLWKTLNSGLRSEHGDCTWKIGEWKKIREPLVMCKCGFHASENVIDAFFYVQPCIVSQVEVRGEHLEQKDKQCWSEMRIVRAWEWTKEDSVKLAIFAAELVLSIFEKKYPDDKRPRAAISAAREWLKDPSAANAANADYAANAAADYAANAATNAAAAYAATAAASAAANAASAYAASAYAYAASAYAASASAYAASANAASAAANAANRQVFDKCHAFVISLLENKTPLQ